MSNDIKTETESSSRATGDSSPAPGSAIRFEKLYIHRAYDGTIKAKLSIKSDDGSKVEITLPEEPLEAIVDLVADKLAQAATVQADRLRDAILDRQSAPDAPGKLLWPKTRTESEGGL